MRTHNGRAHIACAQAVFVRIENCLGSVKLFCGRNHPYVNFTHSAKSLRTNRAISTASSQGHDCSQTDVWQQRQGVGVVVTGAGSWESRYQASDFAATFLTRYTPLCPNAISKARDPYGYENGEGTKSR